MINSCRKCLISLGKYVKKLIARIRSSSSSRKKKKSDESSRRLVSDLSWLTSSFAGMEVSNQLKQVFRFIDSNGDGKISKVELSQVLLSLGHEKSEAAKEAEGMVREMDCDGDGFVDLDEFMSVMDQEASSAGGGGGATREDDDDDLREAFLVFDADKNGVISPKELQRILVNLGCGKSSLKECRRMIRSVDKDGDGFVNFEEFKWMMTLGCNNNNNNTH